MNYRRLFYALIAAGALVVVVVFVFFGGHDDRYRSPYAGYLEQSKLAYRGGLQLRDASAAEGEEQFDQAMKLYAEDRFEPAVKLLQQATEHRPESAPGWLYLGVSHYMLGHAAEAVNSLERADKHASPELRPHVHWYLANALLLSGDRDRAEVLLKSLAAADGPRAPEARTLQANVAQAAVN